MERLLPRRLGSLGQTPKFLIQIKPQPAFSSFQQ